MEKITGILIDPFDLTIKQVEIDKGIDAIYAAIQAKPFDCRDLGAGNTLYFDDEFLLRSDTDRFFAIGGLVIGGRAILLGTDGGGETVSVKVNVETVSRVTVFLIAIGDKLHEIKRTPAADRPQPGFTVTTF